MKKGMNKKARYFFSLLFVFLILCFIVIYFVKEYADPSRFLSQETISYDDGSSSFDKNTILSDIRNGQKDVFSNYESDTENDVSKENISKNIFTDLELLQIVKYYSIIHLEEDIDKWRLVRIIYRLKDCNKGFEGPYSVDYVFEKEVRVDDKKYINERGIGIAEWLGIITWYDKVVNRSSLSNGLNLEKINYYAMDVYNIAEENGGYEIHKESDNQCKEILISLYGDNQNWSIEYDDRVVGTELLELEIDISTGEIVD